MDSTGLLRRPPDASSALLGDNLSTFKAYIASQQDDIACKSSILSLADELQTMLLERGTGIPIFIGGIGDSGTRSLVDFFSAFNVSFGKTSHSRDSVAWMGIYDMVSCTEENATSSVKVGDIYTTILAEHGVFGMEFNDHVRSKGAWFSGLQVMLRVLLQQLRFSGDDAVMVALKQPRTTLLLPMLHKLFGDQLRYIHLLRDPRDLAGGTFDRFFRDVCKIFYTDALDNEQCRGGVRNRLEFDARYDLEAMHWLTGHLNANQYLAIRIEDLVSEDNVPCLHTLLDFAGREWPMLRVLPQTVQEQADNFISHRGSFGGRKFSPKERAEVNFGSLRRAKVLYALRQFGYSMPREQDLEANWETDGFCGQRMPALHH
ncbi:Hypothetical Protein FCC1311_028312 [Hondaea fermentalgiana]|uniref:Protein-tyrosine sulfotransferase n=1 Tax=Hondaea fermentalgiana TaxID=2315210 RepID=A0A2R5G6J0_9STRA|nr:Hypothetical Protein FCC1311_028312 [Hondaea fermentalgiana]|eukprot:GBG26610.1 Hypothetical Protein FCC1311_028312 [Hondaea fermentalgiana]